MHRAFALPAAVLALALVAADGAWHWILNPSDFRAYRAGRCPVTATT